MAKEFDVKLLRESLQLVFDTRYKPLDKSLNELSDDIGVSKSYISGFLSEKLENPSSKLLARIDSFLRSSSLTPADEKRFVHIIEILDEANDDGAILARLIFSRGREPRTEQQTASSQESMLWGEEGF